MVIINTTDDFVRAMDDNPEWLDAVRRRVLTREVLELPEKLAGLSDMVAQLAETTNRRLTALENTVGGLTTSVNRLELHVDSMRGDHLEMRLQGRIHGLLGGSMGLYRIQILRASFPAGSSPEFTDRAADAVMDGIITPEQHGRLMDTDLIVRARRGRDTDRSVYVAVEVSNRLDDEDVIRVVDTGVALARMFPHAEVLTAVYGRSISEEHRLLAQTKGVDVFPTRDRR